MKSHLATTLTTANLAEIAKAMQASHVFIPSMFPGGSARIIHSSAPSASMNRLYNVAGQFVDSPTWEAMLTGKRVIASEFFASRPEAKQEFHAKWLSRLGFAHAVSVPLNSPAIEGFPGALVALGSMGQEPFSEAAIQHLSEAAVRLNDEVNSLSRSATRRLFIATDAGTFKGSSPREVLDSVLATNLEEFARERLADPKPTSAGDRIQMADSRFEMHAFTVSIYESYPAIASGRVLILSAVPEFSEWLTLTPYTFSADAEIGRLLPAFKFMADHFHEGATLPTIASFVHLSPFHFHRRFTELLGITPKHFLFDCQIARAKELLLNASHELEAIAKMCGFAHQSHFTSRFKQATGLTPTRWRKSRLTRSIDATSFERARAG